jgi:hypothetical protein
MLDLFLLPGTACHAAGLPASSGGVVTLWGWGGSPSWLGVGRSPPDVCADAY